MVTLAADVSATERCLRVEGSLDGIEPHSRFRIGDELVDLYGFDKFPRKAGRRQAGLDRTRWLVVRGVGGSRAQLHAAGTTIRAAISASVSSSGIQPPAPFASDITFEGDVATGPEGPMGPEGPAGPQGEPGPEGPQGP